MIEIEERLLRERFRALALASEGADWDDVLRRARRGRVRLLGVVVAGLAAIAITATALGLDRTVINWVSAEPAPPETELSFSTLDKGAPPGLETGVLPGTARKAFDVTLPEGDRATLWVAPTAKGGFCTMIELVDASGRKRGAAGPGCDNRRDATGFGVTVPGPISPEGRIERGPVVIDGHVTNRAASEAIIDFKDGTHVQLTLTWISDPIDAGFFVYGVPPANWQDGHEPVRLRYVDSHGNTVGQEHGPLVFHPPVFGAGGVGS